jgi:hypothetical protein
MAFVKLDCGILDSTLWPDLDAREVFITALLMADPIEIREPMEQIEVGEIKGTGFKVPPGWYGFVGASGPGIVRRAGLTVDKGIPALKRLGDIDMESRTPDFDGRRLVRVDGGYVILNFDRYREKDHTAADRSRRYRERKFSKLHKGNGSVASEYLPPKEAEPEKNIIPEGLRVPEFESAWSRWEQHRLEIRKKLTPSTRKRQLEELAKWGAAKAVAAIDKSIMAGWQGLFDPNENKAAGNAPAGAPRQMTREEMLEAAL